MKFTKLTFAVLATSMLILAAMTGCGSITKTNNTAQSHAPAGNTPQKQATINYPGGGKLMYGAVNATEAANSAEQANFDQNEDNISRNGQGFSNYLLDQSVVQDNQNNTHGTAWNSQADAMVKSNPNRYEIVNTPNYWQGVDY